MFSEIIQAHPAIVSNGLRGNSGKFQIGEVVVSMQCVLNKVSQVCFLPKPFLIWVFDTKYRRIFT